VQVALKCVNKEKLEVGMADFLKEATILHSLEHDHIVLLYGVVLGSAQLTLVTELAPLRSLLECIKEPALRASFPVHVLCDFAYQIADGMSYLESNRLIHRDLAARNILVFAKNKVCISSDWISLLHSLCLPG
jgi:serine/threonine protein kinase